MMNYYVKNKEIKQFKLLHVLEVPVILSALNFGHSLRLDDAVFIKARSFLKDSLNKQK